MTRKHVRKHRNNPSNKAAPRLIWVVFAALFLLSSLTACSSFGKKEEVTGIAQYGDEGALFARQLAQRFPQRYPYSDEESGAAQMIAEELRSYGYEPEIQHFSVTDEEGVRRNSANVIARLSGKGFQLSDKITDEERDRWPENQKGLIMILGAHYDTPEFALDETEEVDEETENDFKWPEGIHNNASGVAAVLTAARVMRQEAPGYDVIFVFLGAGTDEYQGARHYMASLSSEERKQVEVMVNIGPIYAGDKVYAHAGQNSVRSGEYKDYQKRRKLYQVTDIFFDNQMNTKNRYAIYTNQASFLVPTDSGGTAVFREWTTKLSDHTPFDRAGIPVVFIESGEYRVKSVDEVMIESRNPYFQETGGLISGTRFDRIDLLENLFREMDEQQARQTIPIIDGGEEEPLETEEGDEGETQKIVPRLTLRINNTAFVLVQLARKGPLNYDFSES